MNFHDDSPDGAIDNLRKQLKDTQEENIKLCTENERLKKLEYIVLGALDHFSSGFTDTDLNYFIERLEAWKCSRPRKEDK